MTAKKTNKRAIVLSSLSVVNEAYESGHKKKVSKYDAFFETVPEGHRIKCEWPDASPISKALRIWLHRKGRENVRVMISTRCEDGLGGIWWSYIETESTQKKQFKPKTMWQTLAKH
jgi:hypothetical protein